jgi:hypothetical protein
MRKFQDLRGAMSPGAQERAARKAKEMLAALPSNQKRYEEALSHVRPEEERYKYPFYEPVGGFDLIKLTVDFHTGELQSRTYPAYFSINGMICVRQRFGHSPLAHGLDPKGLGQYQYRVTKNRVYGEMWTIGSSEDSALFYRRIAKHLLNRSFGVYPHPTAIRWPENDLIQSKLVEYGYPSNPKNAGRAGWNACYSFYQSLLRNLRRGRHSLRLSEEVKTPTLGSIFPIDDIKKKD